MKIVYVWYLGWKTIYYYLDHKYWEKVATPMWLVCFLDCWPWTFVHTRPASPWRMHQPDSLCCHCCWWSWLAWVWQWQALQSLFVQECQGMERVWREVPAAPTLCWWMTFDWQSLSCQQMSANETRCPTWDYWRSPCETWWNICKSQTSQMAWKFLYKAEIPVVTIALHCQWIG